MYQGQALLIFQSADLRNVNIIRSKYENWRGEHCRELVDEKSVMEDKTRPDQGLEIN